MPTGYTAGLYEGDESFETFVMHAARGMSVLMLMRDAPFDAPIPDKFEPSDYHTKALHDARTRLETAMALTEAQAEELARIANERRTAEYEEAKAKDAARRRRYEEMLAKVEAWQPPTDDHMGFKRFMLEQLTESIRYDCGGGVSDPPKPITAIEYGENEIRRAFDDIYYHKDQLAKEEARCAQRTAWVKALRESLR